MRTILPEHRNPALREIAHEIPVADIRGVAIKKLIADMKSLLAKEKYGVALAASQLGVPLRLFIVSGRALARDRRLPAPSEARQAGNAPDEDGEQGGDEVKPLPALPDQVYINPVLLKMSRTKKEKHEGCLSVRGKWGIVPRAEKTMLSAYDEKGQKMTRGASGFLAHVFQHEMDHLDGILYTDKAAALYDDKPEKK
ncbi:MAG: peptide deformylase [bacterium]|nr:peptide deformylase [bacterium]